MIAAAMLGLIMSLHLAATMDPKIWGRALYVAESVFSYGALASLGIGSLIEGRGSIPGRAREPARVADALEHRDMKKAATGSGPAPPEGFVPSAPRQQRNRAGAKEEVA